MWCQTKHKQCTSSYYWRSKFTSCKLALASRFVQRRRISMWRRTHTPTVVIIGCTLLSFVSILVSLFCLFSLHSCEQFSILNFHRSRNANWVARLGILRRANHMGNPFEQVRRISRIIVHPQYVDKGFINDIVLLQLEQPVKFR